MTRRRATCLVALVVALVGVLPTTAAPAHAQDTTAVVVNTHDGLDMFRAIFQIRRVLQDEVDTTNAAVAYNSCAECSSVAISFQLVVAGGGADVVTPENYAIAVNQQCDTCVAAAFAYQFIVANDDGPLRFTADGNRTLAEVRRRIQELRNADLGLMALQAELDALAELVRRVLDEELVAARESAATAGPTSGPSPPLANDAPSGATATGSPGDGASAGLNGDATSSVPPTASGDSTASPTPATSQDGTPSPTVTASASPTPTPTASASPTPTPTASAA